MKNVITDDFAMYHGDCIPIMQTMEDNIADMFIYSPPFASMYVYSGSDDDLGNCKNYDEFLKHYEYVVRETYKKLKPGRMACIHCMDMPGTGNKGLRDFPGDIIKLHEKVGFAYWDRKSIWKEPLRVAIRTRQRALMHNQLVNDTLKCRGALSDYLLIFRKQGDTEVPVTKPHGLTNYIGDLTLMNRIERKEYKTLMNKYSTAEYTDDKTNRLSQFIWRRYASSNWEDIRASEVLQYKKARDPEDERHVCPLQLDLIQRAVIMYTNPKEVVMTPFAGIGSELYGALVNDRKAIGIELKASYFRQNIKNLESVKSMKNNNKFFNM